MPPVHHPLPRTGEAFLDPRGDGRALRVSWHSEAGVVVLSLWHENLCAGTFQLAIEDVPRLLASLHEGLGAAFRASA